MLKVYILYIKKVIKNDILFVGEFMLLPIIAF